MGKNPKTPVRVAKGEEKAARAAAKAEREAARAAAKAAKEAAKAAKQAERDAKAAVRKEPKSESFTVTTKERKQTGCERQTSDSPSQQAGRPPSSTLVGRARERERD